MASSPIDHQQPQHALPSSAEHCTPVSCSFGMKSIKFSVIGVSIYLMIYTMMPFLNVAYAIMFLLFLIGNILLFYLVYDVLKNGEDSKRKFDEGYWYADVEKKYTGHQS